MKWMMAFILLIGSDAVLAREITVAAAVSMKDVLTHIATDREAAGAGRINFVFGSSGQLQQQILNGAPIDVFISAAAKQMDELVAAGAVDASTRRVVTGNRLALIAPSDRALAADTLADIDWARVQRLAIGEPATVPAGQYAVEVLQRANLATTLADKLITAGNVRQVLSYVERGEVNLGIVYASDALVPGKKVRVVLMLDPGLHQPIVYPGAVVARSKNTAAAKAFLDDLSSPTARKRLDAFGFTMPPTTQAAP